MTGGIPDTNGCLDGVEMWIEFKKTSIRRVTFRPGQPAWIHRRYRAGGRVWIAIRYTHEGGPRLGDPVDDLVLVYGGHILELARDGLEDYMISGRWRGGPRRWPWSTIQGLLVGVGGSEDAAAGVVEGRLP